MWSTVRRCAAMAVLILAAFLLQNSIFGAISLIETTPNLLLLLTVTSGLLHGKVTGVLTGFFAGLLMDVFGGTMLGQYALIYSLLGYGCGYFTPYFDLDMVTLPMLVCVGCELIYGLYVYVTCFMMRGRWNLFFYLKAIILPETVYTLVILVISYRFLVFINRRLEEATKRKGANQFD